MGYLDKSTITVDAVLTKRGREILASGEQNFAITKFALSDDEVDYRLWNPDHPSGSNYYGVEIEELPVMEAFVDETQMMKYKLVTYAKGLAQLPRITGVGTALVFNAGGETSIVAPATSPSSYDTNLGYRFEISDTDIAYLNVNATAPGISNPGTMIGGEDATYYQTVNCLSVKVTAQTFYDNDKTCTLSITGNESGATTTIAITVGKTIKTNIPT